MNPNSCPGRHHSFDKLFPEPEDNLGMKVTVKFRSNTAFGRAVHHRSRGELIHRNVTGTHFNFNHMYSNSPKVAFESDIHGTGSTYHISDILEYNSVCEVEVAESF